MKHARFSIAAVMLPVMMSVGCNHQDRQLQQVSRPVKTVRIGDQPDASVVSFSGEVKARYETTLSFRVAGKLLARQIDVGDRVRKGEVLAKLDPTDYRLAVRGLKAQLAAAVADRNFLKDDLTRYRELLVQQVISPPEFDRHETAYITARERVASLEAQTAKHRSKVIIGTVALFGLGVVTLTQVPEQFFPLSNRPEVIIDLWLPEGSSFEQTEAATQRMEALLAKDEDAVNYTAYIGSGTPRFFLLIVQQLANTNLAEFVVMTKDNEARERVMQRIRLAFATDFPEVRGRVMRLNVGPPMDYPLVFRVFGEDPEIVRSIAGRVADVVRANPNTLDVNDDWHERIPSFRLAVDQDKARALGVSTASLSQTLQAHYTGIPVGQFRENDKLIEIVWRAQKNLRTAADQLSDVAVRTTNGKSVPLSQFVKFETVFEDGVRWRRNRFPAISVRADVADGMLAPDVAAQIIPKLEAIKEQLPGGYFIETGAAKEDAWIAQKSILVWIPLVVIATLIILMMQLQNLSRTFLVFSTAPLGVIGGAFALMLFHAPFGFVALLGIIALAGMIMRNSVILVDQIEQDEKAGRDTWSAIVESTVRRFRPILLTAAAAILAMIPLSRNDFFGPQAIAIMGGLVVATALTVFFLPALYAAWFRVNRAQPDDTVTPDAGAPQ